MAKFVVAIDRTISKVVSFEVEAENEQEIRTRYETLEFDEKIEDLRELAEEEFMDEGILDIETYEE